MSRVRGVCESLRLYARVIFSLSLCLLGGVPLTDPLCLSVFSVEYRLPIPLSLYLLGGVPLTDSSVLVSSRWSTAYRFLCLSVFSVEYRLPIPLS